MSTRRRRSFSTTSAAREIRFRGIAGRDLRHGLDRAWCDDHAARPEGTAGAGGADIAVGMDDTCETLDIGELQIGLAGERHCAAREMIRWVSMFHSRSSSSSLTP